MSATSTPAAPGAITPPGPPAQPSERAAIYRELHGAALERLHAKENIEWIVNAGLWAGIVLVGGQLAEHTSLAASLSARAIFFAGPAAFALHYVLWMRPLQESENRSARMARDYRILAQLALVDRDLYPAGESLEKRWADQDKTLFMPDDRHESLVTLEPGARGLRAESARYRWPIVECFTTCVLIWIVLGFLKLVEWIPSRD